jgi:hypothetical protein
VEEGGRLRRGVELCRWGPCRLGWGKPPVPQECSTATPVLQIAALVAAPAGAATICLRSAFCRCRCLYSICWRQSYTAKSAYLAQFRGSYSTFNSTALWKAHTEGKHRLFAWLLIQEIYLAILCVLCDQLPESAAHLCLDCVYARQVWELVFVWTEGRVTAPARNISVEMWWNSSLQRLPRKEQSQTAAVLIYTAWSLRKERNRRVRGFQVTGNSFPTHAAGDEAPTGPLWGLELFLS